MSYRGYKASLSRGTVRGSARAVCCNAAGGGTVALADLLSTRAVMLQYAGNGDAGLMLLTVGLQAHRMCGMWRVVTDWSL